MLVCVFAFPSTAFSAVTYTRLPIGTTTLSPVTITVSANSFSDYGLSAGVDRYYITLDDDILWPGGANPHTDCFPITQLSANASFDVPIGGAVKGVVLVGFTGACETGDESYYLEGTGDSAIFTIPGVSLQQLAAPEDVAVTTMSASERQALIARLMRKVELLRGELAALSGVNSNTTNFKRDLYLGVSGDDVKQLQGYLNTHGYAVAESGLDSTGSPRAGSFGNETNYFGRLTQEALTKFQTAVGISPSAGYFGPKTRARVDAQ